jgi:hypothetical protein
MGLSSIFGKILQSVNLKEHPENKNSTKNAKIMYFFEKMLIFCLTPFVV